MFQNTIRKQIINGLCIIFLALFCVCNVNAQVEIVEITIHGLACPFCAYGVEKKLKKLDGVKSLDIRINDGLAILIAEKGKSIDVHHVPKAVKDAGFTPVKIKITAEGIVKVNKRGQIIFQTGEIEQAFLLTDLNDSKDWFLSQAKLDGVVRIVGIIEEQKNGVWSISPKTFKKILK